jgi:hypothetical protein
LVPTKNLIVKADRLRASQAKGTRCLDAEVLLIGGAIQTVEDFVDNEGSSVQTAERLVASPDHQYSACNH